MARRRRTSPIDDLLELATLLPWWVSLSLALASYLFLSGIASSPVAMNAAAPGQVANVVTQTIWRTLASFGQWVVPAIFVIGAVASVAGKQSKKALAGNVAASPSADALNGMSWQQFEQLVGESFRQQGYVVTETGGGGADGGVDLVLRKGSERSLVQCKQWRAFKVGVDVVRQLYGVMAATGAASGFVVTSGRFTEEAARFASGRNVQLIDGPKLFEMLKRAQAARARSTTASPSTSPQKVAPEASAEYLASMRATLMCGRCGKPMVKRLARRGTNAGNEFWGCTGYPGCKETRAI